MFLACWLERRSANGCEGALCSLLYRPVPEHRPKVRVNAWWDPSRDPRKRSQQVGRSSRCLVEASPMKGVAQEGPRLKRNIAEQWHRPIGLEPRPYRTTVRRRERWLQGHKFSTRRGYPDSWSTPATIGRPRNRYGPWEGYNQGRTTCMVRGKGGPTPRASS